MPASVLPGNHVDMVHYLDVANSIVRGGIPYRDVPFEYPPLALVPMLAARLIGGAPDLETFHWAWAALTAAVVGATGLMLAWIAGRAGDRRTARAEDRRPARTVSAAGPGLDVVGVAPPGGPARLGLASPVRVLVAWAALVLLLPHLVTWRFDIWAVALAVAAVALLLADRPALSGATLAMGVLVKVFPVALLPVLLAWAWYRGDRSGAVRLAVAFVAAGAAVMLVVAAVAGVGPALTFVDYQQGRLVQIESVAASVTLVAHLVLGSEAWATYGYQSIQLNGLGTGLVVSLQPLLLPVAMLAAAGLAALRFRSERADGDGPDAASLVAWSVVALGVLVVVNKVFSAQYVLWVLPLACLLPRRTLPLTLAVAGLTSLMFPFLYPDLIELHAIGILEGALRNGLLLALVAWTAFLYRPWGLSLAWRARRVGVQPPSARTS